MLVNKTTRRFSDLHFVHTAQAHTPSGAIVLSFCVRDCAIYALLETTQSIHFIITWIALVTRGQTYTSTSTDSVFVRDQTNFGARIRAQTRARRVGIRYLVGRQSISKTLFPSTKFLGYHYQEESQGHEQTSFSGSVTYIVAFGIVARHPVGNNMGLTFSVCYGQIFTHKMMTTRNFSIILGRIAAIGQEYILKRDVFSRNGIDDGNGYLMIANGRTGGEWRYIYYYYYNIILSHHIIITSYDDSLLLLLLFYYYYKYRKIRSSFFF